MLSIGLLVILIGLLILPGYFFPSDRELIEKAIRKGAKAIEKKNLEALEEIVSDDYYGYYQTSKSEAREQAKKDFQKIENLKIEIKKIEIEIKKESEEVDVVCEFVVSGFFKDAGIYNKVPFRGIFADKKDAVDRAKMIFKKEPDSNWRLVEFEVSIPDITSKH